MARPITLGEAEFVAHALATELMDYIDEPIPPFHTRAPNILESCLLEPFQTFGGEELHPTFYKKTAILFYLVIKNHPFGNGNKRMAVVLTGVFCIVNGYGVKVPPHDLYEVACRVAESTSEQKDQIVESLEKTFRAYIYPTSPLNRLRKKRNN